VVDIIHAIRAAVLEEFCVGIKLNSVDHQSEGLPDYIEQLKLITAVSVDFLEISGGIYENLTVGIKSVSILRVALMLA
jgi:2,4-dienoyl-CoA reductase-like NADH-dependent reductase (Old Yellow Enzyme family)